jgi:hypothetical protein
MPLNFLNAFKCSLEQEYSIESEMAQTKREELKLKIEGLIYRLKLAEKGEIAQLLQKVIF